METFKKNQLEKNVFNMGPYEGIISLTWDPIREYLI